MSKSVPMFLVRQDEEEIEVVAVYEETATHIRFKDWTGKIRREKKDDVVRKYCKTEKEALDQLMYWAETSLMYCELSVSRAQHTLEKIKERIKVYDERS